MLLDVTPGRAVGEWWHVDTVQAGSASQSMAAVFQLIDGTNRHVSAAQTIPRLNLPALAP